MFSMKIIKYRIKCQIYRIKIFSVIYPHKLDVESQVTASVTFMEDNNK